MIEFVMGIDPGATGAVAFIPTGDQGDYVVYDCPEDVKGMASLIRDMSTEHKISFCILESVHAMPGNGCVSMFKFGGNFGAWRGILDTLEIPYILVTPRMWQKIRLGDEVGNTKERSLAKAREQFPDADLRLKRHDGRADALHLAQYGMNCLGDKA